MSDESRNVNRFFPVSWRPSRRGVPALVGTFFGVDLRRPASWIGLAMGVWVGWWCATSTGAGGGIAMLAAAALTVAAIGDIPAAICFPAGRGLPLRRRYEWACERAAWPLVGMMLGTLAAGGGSESFSIVPAAVVGGLLAAVTTVVIRLSGAKAADAASLTLLLAAASAAAHVGLASRLGGSGVIAVAAWLLLGGVVWVWAWAQNGAIDAGSPGSHRAGHGVGADMLHVDALPASGPLRQTLTRLAMVGALAAMVCWLMLEPAIDSSSGDGLGHFGQAFQWGRLRQVDRAALAWALFTAAWFVGLAVPQATLQDGIVGTRGWESLFRTSAGARRGSTPSRWGVRSPRPGPARFAGGVALTQAAILGWPVVVCVVLSLPTPAAARLPLCIVIGLAVAAAVVTAIASLGAALRASRETMFAATLAIVIVALAFTVDVTCTVRQSFQPVSPSLPRLVSPALQRLGGG